MLNENIMTDRSTENIEIEHQSQAYMTLHTRHEYLLCFCDGVPYNCPRKTCWFTHEMNQMKKMFQLFFSYWHTFCQQHRPWTAKGAWSIVPGFPNTISATISAVPRACKLDQIMNGSYLTFSHNGNGYNITFNTWLKVNYPERERELKLPM